MTDPIASASIFIRPDTTGFRALLEAEIRKATIKPITIPVVAAPLAKGATATITQAAGATTALATATQRQAAAAAQSAAATTSQARSMGQLQRGAASTALSMAGIRGATLAASGAFLAGAAAIALFAKAIGSVTSLTQQLAVFAVTTGATAGEMENVSAAAKQMGADLTLPGISAGDAATAMTELAKAGLSVQDAIDGARGVLQLAIAANISFADATQLAASALNAFGLEGADAIRVADTLANAANAAQGSIGDMGLALQQAAAVGRQVGLTLEDTTTFLTQLAREGIRGSDAGTSLRVTLGRLINPTAKIAAEMEKLGVSLRDAQGNIRPDFFVNLGIAMQGMSKAQKDATLAIIGGMDGMRALSILTRQSIGDTLGLSNQLRQQGTAADQASARMTGLTGAASNLSNTLQGIGLSIGRSVTPALTGLTAGLTTAAATIAAAFGAINEAIGVGVILAAVAAYKLLPPVLVAATSAFRGVTIATIASTVAMARAAGVAATLRIAMTAMLTSFNLPVLAATAAIGGLILFFSRYKSAAEQAKNATDDLLRSMEQLDSAAQNLKTTQQNLAGAQLDVQQAKINVVLARQAIALSGAKQGTIEYAQLQNNLKVALNQVDVAEDNLATTLERLTLAIEQNTIAMENNEAALADAGGEIEDLIDKYENGVGSTTSFARSLENANEELLKLAAAHRAENTEFSIGLAKREQAIAALQRELDRFATPTEIRLLLESKTVESGLKEIERELLRTGEQGGKGFTDNVMFGLNQLPGLMSQTLNGIFEMMINGFSAAGVSSANAIIVPIQSALAAVQQLIASVLGGAQAAVGTTIGQRIGLKEAGGDTAGALADTRAKVRMFERIRARAKARGDQETFSKATDELIQAQNDANSLEQQLASEAAAGAKATASAVSSAQDARDDADQAIIDLFQSREQRRELRIALAENTKRLSDDLAAQIALKKFLIAQIGIFREQIKDKETERQAIADLRAKIAAVTGAISQLREEQRNEARERRAAREERKRERRDERLEGLRLNIQIAEARESIEGERTARERLIRALIAARNNVKRGTNEWRRLTLEIEQEKKAIRELTKKTKERGKLGASLQFEFMRQQQGFAATLLGNLVPGNAALGTVGSGTTGLRIPGTGLLGGSSSQSARALKNFATPRTAFEHGRGQGRGTGARDLTAAGAPRGTTQAQTGTMIELLRGILRALNGQKRNAAIPEAQYEKSKGSANSEMI